MGRTDQWVEGLGTSDLDPIFLVVGIIIVAIVWFGNERSKR